MPPDGPRTGQSGKELQRRSTLEPFQLKPPEHDEPPQRGTVSSDFPAIERPITAGEDPFAGRVKRKSSFLGLDLASQDQDENPSSSRKPQDSTRHSRSLNFYKWRHASDSQLGAKAKAQAQQQENIPAVPALPQEPPVIVMTAPTQDEGAVHDKKKPKFPLFPRSKSPAPSSNESKAKKNIGDKPKVGDKRKTVFGNLRNLKDNPNMPDRSAQSLDLNALSGSGRREDGQPAPAPSFDEQDRVDSKDHLTRPIPTDHLTNRPLERPSINHSRSWIPLRKKNRQSLFPLPVKIPPPQVPTAPATPRASTSGRNSGSPNRSPSEYSPPLTSIHRTSTADGSEKRNSETQHPPLHSPLTHGALAATSISVAAPGVVLGRTSSTSGHSERSVPASALAPPLPPTLRRGRSATSATLGSMGPHDDVPMPPPTPPTLGGSGRTSTSTGGRSSFSNLLTLGHVGHRFRQGSEPYSPRQGSPVVNGAISGLASQSNSFSISRDVLKIVLPERQEGESAGRYLERVEECVDKSQIPAVLSKQNDEFFLAVMRSAMRKFAFFGDPLDMSIRKLLMEVDLPKETQQIDRFLQSFADRYHECNPGIFISADKAYFVAFSLLILQTDAFNRNNKRKMNKPDYLKNSSTDGVSEDVLGCFYDNIVYTPFIRVEDDVEFKSSKRKSKKMLTKHGTVESLKAASKEPIDPYELILSGRLDILRPPIKDVMNLEDPYSYTGTASHLDVKSLHKHSKAGVLQIESSRSRPDAFLSPATIENPEEAKPGLIDLPVDKVGVLWRKDPKRKTARSPWQEWGALLTGSGLSFFKNAGWVKNLMHQHKSHSKHSGSGSVIFRPPIQIFKPDHLLPTENGVALHDRAYKRHKNAFVFFSQSGTEEVFLADDEAEMNDWLARINHQASYRTANIRPRGLVGGNYEGQRQRALRRLESSNSAQTVQTPTGEVTIQSGNIDFLLAQQISAARRESMTKKIDQLEEHLGAKIRELECQLRDSRHLMVLAPIQQKTREQLVHAAGRISAKIKWTRVEIWRMKCHRDILALDLEDENKMAGAAPKSPKLPPVQLSPTLSSTPSTDRLARLGGTLHLGTTLPSDAGSLPKPGSEPGSPELPFRPDTKHTASSHNTELSDEDAYKTPPENTPQPSPAFPPAFFGTSPGIDRAPSRASKRTALSPKLEAARPASVASSIQQRTLSEPSEAGESEYSTPVVEDDYVYPYKARPMPPSMDGRPGTASDSETDPTVLTGSPESRKGHHRSLQRTLRDRSTHGHHRSRKGLDSGSSGVLSEVGNPDTQEAEKLARKHGSFTLHGKKASVVTFGSEWQDMSPEERLKLRKEAHFRESQLSTSTVAVEDGDAEPQHRRGIRTMSVSSVQSTPITGFRRESNVSGSSANELRRESNASGGARSSAVERERKASRKASSQSVMGLTTSPKASTHQPRLAVDEALEERKSQETKSDGEEASVRGKDKGKARAVEEEETSELKKIHSPQAQVVHV